MNQQQLSTEAAPPVEENFADLLAESTAASGQREGTVVTGTVIAIENDAAIIDVGLKTEGKVPIREFTIHGRGTAPAVGDEVEVFLDRIENRHGEAVLSRDRARREQAWSDLENAFESRERVQGVIYGRVKGGYTVDLLGASAFLPRSQVDIRPMRDASHLMGSPEDFYILKMDRRRGNIVISRRAVLEETRAEARAELVASLKEGQILDGVVKNITEYGAFVDLGEVDGLLHVADMSWRRVHHPSEVVSVGQKLRVQVVRFNPTSQRISLGIKQLEADPWEGVEQKYLKDTKLRGRVTNITDYGAFVELEPGIEGLVHVSEMSWVRKSIHPSKMVSTSEEVEVMILDVDPVKRRVSLGMRQCFTNPWEALETEHPVGSLVEGEVRSITDFGLFIGMSGDIDGLVHLSDLDSSRSGEEAIKDYKKGDKVQAKVLEIDREKERVNLGIRQISDEIVAGALSKYRKGQVVTCTVTEVNDGGIGVSIDDVSGFIRRADISRMRSDQNPTRFAVGERVDAKVTGTDRRSQGLALSIKALEREEEQKALRDYGSSDSGASLGDILGDALKARRTGAEDAAEAEEKPEAEAEKPAAEEEKAEEPEKASAEPAAEEAAETKEADAAEEGKAEEPEEAPAEPAAEEAAETKEADAAEEGKAEEPEKAPAKAAAKKPAAKKADAAKKKKPAAKAKKAAAEKEEKADGKEAGAEDPDEG